MTRHLTGAQAARALGVSARALRLYEDKGLVAPGRTASGWRVYGPEHLARLHQVIALKGLGFDLRRIAELLGRGGVGLAEVLGAQERALLARRAEADRALQLVRRARAELKAGRALSVDDLTTLTRETVMAEPLPDAEMKALFQPLIARHYDPARLETLKGRAYDHAAVGRAWSQLIAEAKAVQAKGDPTTPEAADVARRWKALQDQFAQGDPDLIRRAGAVWAEALADPELRPKLPFGPELMAFMREARKAAGL